MHVCRESAQERMVPARLVVWVPLRKSTESYAIVRARYLRARNSLLRARRAFFTSNIVHANSTVF